MKEKKANTATLNGGADKRNLAGWLNNKNSKSYLNKEKKSGIATLQRKGAEPSSSFYFMGAH